MGAGVAKGLDPEAGRSSSRSSSSSVHPPASTSTAENSMSSCEGCSIRFSILKRKKLCCECGKNHCSGCLTKSQATNGVRRRCQKCQLLVSGRFTRNDLMDYKVKDLRQFLLRRHVAISDCTEKADLVEALLRFNNSSQYRMEQDENHRRIQHLQQQRLEQEQLERQRQFQRQQQPQSQPQQQQQQQQQQHTPSSASSSSSSSAARETTAQPSFPNSPPSYEEVIAGSTAGEPQPGGGGGGGGGTPAAGEAEERLGGSDGEEHPSTSTTAPSSSSRPPQQQRTRLETIAREEDIEELTVLQLKEVLANSYVDYKGCVEKWELVDRVRRLWRSNAENKVKATQAEEHESSVAESDICKICMEAMIDCVLLECGHMVTCTQCGKQMAECPICRQYVVRVVHVFK